MTDAGRRGATIIAGYWAGNERFDTLEEMIAAWQRQLAERETSEAGRLRAQEERRRKAKRRRIRADYGHRRPASLRRARRKAKA